MTFFMVLYAGIIPAVPLYGFEIFRKRKDKPKQWICLLLFFLQLFISGYAVYIKFIR